MSMPVFFAVSKGPLPKPKELSALLEQHGGVDGNWLQGLACAGVVVEKVSLRNEDLREALSSARKLRFEPVAAARLGGPFDAMEDFAEALLGASGGVLLSESGEVLLTVRQRPANPRAKAKPKAVPPAKVAIDVSIPAEVEARFPASQGLYRLARRRPIDVKFAAVVKALGPSAPPAGFSRLGQWDHDAIGNLIVRKQGTWEPWAKEIEPLGIGVPDGYLFLQLKYWYDTTPDPAHWRAMLQVFCAAARSSKGALWRMAEGGELVAYDFGGGAAAT